MAEMVMASRHPDQMPTRRLQQSYHRPAVHVYLWVWRWVGAITQRNRSDRLDKSKRGTEANFKPRTRSATGRVEITRP
jgi:hypothetical protein